MYGLGASSTELDGDTEIQGVYRWLAQRSRHSGCAEILGVIGSMSLGNVTCHKFRA